MRDTWQAWSRRVVQPGRAPARLGTLTLPPPTSLVTAEPASGMPLLSVVVPAYNVQDYIAETMASLLSQTYDNLDIVVVDDGSTDDTALMIDEFAALDDRVTVIHQANGGLSRARNVGIEAARGAFLAFADSDDVVPVTAYEHLMASLLRTGSDFATGNVRRFDGHRSWHAWNQSHSHRVGATRATLETRPDLVFDLVCWNKVYDRSFIDRIGLRFPEGRLYEDMQPMADAYARATSVDVLTRTVYRWRRRSSGDSITQQRHDLGNLEHKVRELDRAHTIVAAVGGAALEQHYLTKVLQGDLWVHAPMLAGGDDAFRRTFAEAAEAYWRVASPEVRRDLPDHQRSFYSTMVRHGLPAALDVAAWFAEHAHDMPTKVRGGVVQIDPPEGDHSPIVPPLSRSSRTLISGSAVVSHVASMTWQGSHLHLTGHAYIPHIDNPHAQTVTIQAKHLRTGRVIPLSVRRTRSPLAARTSRSTTRNYLWSGFTAHLDTRRLRARADEPPLTGRWQLEVTVEVDRLQRTAPLDSFDGTGSLRTVGPRRIRHGLEMMPRAVARQPLGFDVRRPQVVLQSFEVIGRTVTLVVRHREGLDLAAARLAHPHPLESVDGTVRGGAHTSRIRFDIPAAVSRSEITRRLKVVTRSGRTLHVSPGDVPSSPAGGSSLSLATTRTGFVDIADLAKSAVVDTVDLLDDHRARLSGVAPAGLALEAAVHHTNARPTAWAPVRVDGDRFSVVVDLGQRDWYGVRRPRPSGTYTVALRAVSGQFADDSWQLRTSPALLASLPSTSTSEDVHVTVKATAETSLRFALAPPLSDEDRGAYAIRRLRDEFGPDADVVPEEAVFFVCDIGSTAAGHPLAIYHELRRRHPDLRCYWGVVDHSVPVPPGVIPVIKFSRAWYVALARSTRVVLDYGTAEGFVPRPHQTCLQTWHGTPYKFIGRSQVDHQDLGPDESRRRSAEGGTWDLLLSPSPFYSDVVPAELDYTGPVVESGSPRNDVLVTTGDRERERLRERLGIPRGKRVLLYMPTFRDRLRAAWSAAPFRGLDLDALARMLGDEWVVIARGHSFNARHGSQYTTTNQRVVDATHHHDVNHLYLVADVLVTDYSSAMFDFAVTDRPMLFFVPDHQAYLAARGAYLDLAEVAPGPLCASQEDLYIALGRLDDHAATWGERHAAFRRRFAPWDDGAASGRVVDALLAGGRAAVSADS